MSKPKTVVPLHEPEFAGNEWKYVKSCLDTGWVSSGGAFVTRFERETAARLGAREAVAVVNGTAGLHLALRAAGVGPGDEVLVPSITFIATANAAAYQGAVPRFVDSEPYSLGMDPVKLEAWLEKNTRLAGKRRVERKSGRRVAACVPVHVFGHPARIVELAAICARYGIALIEDAAESLGSTYRGRACGSFGLAGCLSFNGNKTITTGGGGMVVSSNAAFAKRVRHLSTQAKKDAAVYLHDEVGYNYRLPNINAALGCAQLEGLDHALARKRRTAERYRDGLAGANGVSLVWEPAGARSNFWLNTARCDTPARAKRLQKRLNDAGYEARPLWTPCHRQPMFEKLSAGSLDTADALWRTCFNVPSSAALPGRAVDEIVRLLRRS
ncbi:MAG: LegC family aminotransferase [Elusimicrobia bacterium]|nr:LegC family aminotransferase [Elusimicrobiota bacterium]